MEMGSGEHQEGCSLLAKILMGGSGYRAGCGLHLFLATAFCGFIGLPWGDSIFRAGFHWASALEIATEMPVST